MVVPTSWHNSPKFLAPIIMDHSVAFACQIVSILSAVMASFAVSSFSRPVGVAAPARRPLRMTARPSQMRVKASPTTEVLQAYTGYKAQQDSDSQPELDPCCLMSGSRKLSSRSAGCT